MMVIRQRMFRAFGWIPAETPPMAHEYIRIFPNRFAIYSQGKYVYHGKPVHPLCWKPILGGHELRAQIVQRGGNPDAVVTNLEAAKAISLIDNLLSYAAPKPMPWYLQHAELVGLGTAFLLVGIIGLLRWCFS